MIPKVESQAIAQGERIKYYRSPGQETRYPHEVNVRHLDLYLTRRRARRGEAVAA